MDERVYIQRLNQVAPQSGIGLDELSGQGSRTRLFLKGAISLNFNKPPRINKARNFNEGAGGLYLGE